MEINIWDEKYSIKIEKDTKRLLKIKENERSTYGLSCFNKTNNMLNQLQRWKSSLELSSSASAQMKRDKKGQWRKCRNLRKSNGKDINRFVLIVIYYVSTKFMGTKIEFMKD